MTIDSSIYAVWIYGREEQDRCYFHSPSAAREIPGEVCDRKGGKKSSKIA